MSIKRLFDLAVVLLTAPIWIPALTVVAAVAAWQFGRPVLFRQTRPGLRGRPFVLVKFRTMTEERDDAGNLLPDSARLRPFGRLLRSTSLDELPEIWNVVRGDMSLVGPRPLLPQYLERYSESQWKRMEAMPGITGLAQVKGRNAISWEERFQWDLVYVEHHSLWLDIKLLIQTIGVVFLRRGVAAPGEVTMPEFFRTDDERKPGERGNTMPRSDSPGK